VCRVSNLDFDIDSKIPFACVVVVNVKLPPTDGEDELQISGLSVCASQGFEINSYMQFQLRLLLPTTNSDAGRECEWKWDCWMKRVYIGSGGEIKKATVPISVSVSVA